MIAPPHAMPPRAGHTIFLKGSMVRSLVPVSALLFSMAILLVGQGLQNTLLPIRADLEAYSDLAIGGMGSAYFFGFLLGCVLGPYLVRRVGHIRTFAALAATASAAPLVHAVILEPFTWSLLRMVTGFCFAGLYMVIESWLNERATSKTRGGVLAAYNIVNLTALMGGQVIIAFMNPGQFAVFAVASILLSIALVPVSLTTSTQPAPIESVKLDIERLWQVSPVGIASALAVGLANGSFWTLGPVFAAGHGFDVPGTAVYMSAVILGGAVLQWPLGRLSDRMDRRFVISGGFFTAGLAGLFLFFASSGLLGTVFAAHPAILVGGFLFGAFAMPTYAVAVAHLNDRLDEHEFVTAASGLLLIYGIGAMVGPIAAAVVTQLIGGAGLFAFTFVIHMLTSAYVVYRIGIARPVSSGERGEFVVVTRSSPEAVVLDPRADERSESDAENVAT